MPHTLPYFPPLNRSAQITRQALVLLAEADGASGHDATAIYKATRTVSRRGVAAHNLTRALATLEAAGQVEVIKIEGMGGGLTLYRLAERDPNRHLKAAAAGLGDAPIGREGRRS